MKIFLIFLLLSISSNLLSSERTYFFKRTQTMAGDINALEGTISFKKAGNKEIIDVNLQGNQKFNFWDDIEFQSEMDIQNGLEIYDIRKKGESSGFSIFAHHININDFKPGYKTRNIETERRHPYFKDYSWNFYFHYVKNQIISINNENINVAYVILNGDRPTGGPNCRSGQPGVIKVESWYQLNTSKLLKQVFSKFLCKPYDYNLLERDTYIIQ